MPVEVQVTDTREILVPVPANKEDTARLAKFVAKAAAEGYRLFQAGVRETGQRDPVVVGIRLKFKRDA